MFHGQQTHDREAWFKWAEAEASIVTTFMNNYWKLYPTALMNKKVE